MSIEQRIAKLKKQGIEVVQRDMAFIRGAVSCSNCQCNYNASAPEEKTFCQVFSVPIDPAEVGANMLKAEACDQWVPDILRRDQVVNPDYTTWYEEWDGPA